MAQFQHLVPIYEKFILSPYPQIVVILFQKTQFYLFAYPGVQEQPYSYFEADIKAGKPPFMCTEGHYIRWNMLCDSIIQCRNGEDEDPYKCVQALDQSVQNHEGKLIVSLI